MSKAEKNLALLVATVAVHCGYMVNSIVGTEVVLEISIHGFKAKLEFK